MPKQNSTSIHEHVKALQCSQTTVVCMLQGFVEHLKSACNQLLQTALTNTLHTDGEVVIKYLYLAFRENTLHSLFSFFWLDFAYTMIYI